MNQLKKSTIHVIVQFMEEKQCSNKESIDLVLRTWLTRCTNKWMLLPREKRLAQSRQMGKNIEKCKTSLEVMGSDNIKRSRYLTI